MELSNYNIYPTQIQNQQSVANRSVVLGSVTTNNQGAGVVDLFVAGQDAVKSAFEKPIEVRNDQGDLLRTLKPFSKEAMEYLCNGGLANRGLAMEKQ